MLYHVDVQWPAGIPVTVSNLPIEPTRHALDRAVTKGINLPLVATGSAFEVEIIGGRVTKLAVRCPYSSTHDLCLVISREGALITCWLNHKQDTHRTLDTSKYVNSFQNKNKLK